VLWAGPLVFLAVGAVVFWRILAARRNQPLDEDPA
jgi:cytochrome c-type biogenesis protein CcmH/NrfF